MPKYNVLVTSDATVSTIVDVEADSPEAAEALALEQATSNPSEFDWTPDEGNSRDPYICDPGNCAEEVLE